MTPIRADPLYGAARQVLRQISRPASSIASSLGDVIEAVRDGHARLERTWRLLRTAERHGWNAAAGRMRQELTLDAQTLHHQANNLIQRQERIRIMTAEAEVEQGLRPSLRLILDELRQLEDEFTHVEYSSREKVLTAHTEPIELQGLELGPFAIELRLGRNWHGADSASFRCIALQPNPASSNDSVTHPHVSDGGLCAGDATVPIATALRQGRICDAFCLVLAVLQEYNPHSPYVAVENWDGVRCHDCGDSTDRDDLFFCEDCENDVCSDCYGRCDVCDAGRCRSCLERDDVTRRQCCSECRHACSKCGRTVDSESFVADTDLCPECEAQRVEDELELAEVLSNPNHQENEHEHDDIDDTVDTGDPTPAPTVAAHADGAADARLGEVQPDPGEVQAQVAPAPLVAA